MENLERNCSSRIYVPFSLTSSHLNYCSEIMPRAGDFASFFRPGGWSFALKSCPWGRDFDRKN